MLKVETTIKKIIDTKGGMVVSLAANCKVAGKDYLILVDDKDESAGTCLINDKENAFYVCGYIKNSVNEIFNSCSKAIFYLQEQKPAILRAANSVKEAISGLQKVINTAGPEAKKALQEAIEATRELLEEVNKLQNMVNESCVLNKITVVVTAVNEMVGEANAVQEAVNAVQEAVNAVQEAANAAETAKKEAETAKKAAKTAKKAAETAKKAAEAAKKEAEEAAKKAVEETAEKAAEAAKAAKAAETAVDKIVKRYSALNDVSNKCGNIACAYCKENKCTIECVKAYLNKTSQEKVNKELIMIGVEMSHE